MAENEGPTTTTTTDAGTGKGREQGKGAAGTGTGSGTAGVAGAGTNGGAGGAGGGDDLIERLRNENREIKRQAAELRTKAQRLDELEEASKTEQQKANDRAAAAEKAATEATTKLLRYEVAAAKGVPAKLAGRLQGSTREEMEADADDLLATLGTAGAGGQQRRTAGNARDEGGAPGGDMNSWLRGRFRQGA